MINRVLSMMAIVTLFVGNLNAQDDYPPNPVPGKCYAKCIMPDEYKTEFEKVKIKEASKRFNVVPAVYEWKDEKVLVKEASQRISKKEPVYSTKYETVTIAEASTKWVKGKADPNCLSANPDDCRVLCLIEIPKQTKQVATKVLVTPGSTLVTDIPAVYKTVRKRVVKTPASKTEIDVPAEFKDISRSVFVKKGGWSTWKEVVCANEVTMELVRAIQYALESKGYTVGQYGLDNILGKDTRAALIKYQVDNKLPQGNLNVVTLRHLGVR